MIGQETFSITNYNLQSAWYSAVSGTVLYGNLNV